MALTILITGSTDGIGLETAKLLVAQGHRVLLHGRNPEKLAAVENTLANLTNGGPVESYVADLSRISDVEGLANDVTERHPSLDVLINNAGVFKTADPITEEGLDVRFIVNTIAPYLLTQKLMPLMRDTSRVINLSSAAQAPVDTQALSGKTHIPEAFTAYAQSKLALTMWSRSMALTLKGKGPMIVAINPGSMLGTKMVKDGFGVSGGDIAIGAEILTRAALSEEFEKASGLYFDNDVRQFSSPHADALDAQKSETIVNAIESILKKITGN